MVYETLALVGVAAVAVVNEAGLQTHTSSPYMDTLLI